MIRMALVLLPLLASAALAGKPAAPAAPVRISVVAPQAIASDPQNQLRLDLSNGGHVTILLRPDAAPKHVERIRTLAQRGFYNGVIFHRVIPGFMAQTGDPTGTGGSGSDLPNLPAEFNTLPHMRGMVAAARTDDPNSFNSQFFIMFSPNFGLDQKYTVFGRVIEGMATVDAIAQGEPPQDPTRIVRATIGGVSAAPISADPARQSAAPPAAEPPGG